MIKNHLMSYDQYAQELWPVPHIFSLKSANKQLVYFGSNHVIKSGDDQVAQIKNYWEDFLKQTNGKDRVALVEGGVRPVASSEEMAVIKNGEAGLVCFMSNRDGVNVSSPEPDRQQEVAHLLSKFSKDEVMYYYVARMIPVWHLRNVEGLSFEKYVQKTIDRYKKLCKLENFSYEDIKSFHKQLFNKEFNPNDLEFFRKVINPVTELPPINKVTRASARFRDIAITHEIVRLWNEGKSIFAIFGGTHAIIQEPALRKLLV